MTTEQKENLIKVSRALAATEPEIHKYIDAPDEPETLDFRFYRGVWEYVVELAETLDDYDAETLAGVTLGSDLWKLLHNGAEDWAHYSAGGCSLIYTDAIWERLGARSDDDRAELCKACDDGLQNWPCHALGGAASRAFRSAKYGRRCSDDLAVQAAALAIASHILANIFDNYPSFQEV